MESLSASVSDAYSKQFRRCTVSNANGITKTQVYYPRPRSYSAGSQNTTVTSNKRLSAPITSTSTSSGGAPPTPAMKVVRINAKLYGKAKSLEEGKKALGSPTGSIGSNGGGSSSTMRYKTELCRPFQENGFCKYGDKCQFAHGEHDLRSLPRHPKYKTELCRTYHTRGFCPYGLRCHFIHHIDETRKNIEGGCGGIPKSPTKQRSFSFNMPLSPSLDSGISSPDDYQRGKYFEFPIGSGDHGSGSSGSSGSEGEFRDFEHSFEQDVVTSGGGCVPPSYRPLHQQDSITSPDPFLDLDMNSVGSDSPLKPLPDDFPMEVYSMQELMSQITLEDTTTTAAVAAAAASATTACCSSPHSSSPSSSSSSVLQQQQQQQQGRCRSNSSNSGHRLPVFDDMLNTRSDSALLEGNLNSNQSPSHLGSFFGAM